VRRVLVFLEFRFGPEPLVADAASVLVVVEHTVDLL
jgi:hypothetical protein